MYLDDFANGPKDTSLEEIVLVYSVSHLEEVCTELEIRGTRATMIAGLTDKGDAGGIQFTDYMERKINEAIKTANDAGNRDSELELHRIKVDIARSDYYSNILEKARTIEQLRPQTAKLDGTAAEHNEKEANKEAESWKTWWDKHMAWTGVGVVAGMTGAAAGISTILLVAYKIYSAGGGARSR